MFPTFVSPRPKGVASSADYNSGNPDAPSNRGIPEDNCPARFCVPASLVMSGLS